MSDKVISLDSIRFSDEREKQLFQEAKFGQDVVDFLRTDVGRYLYGVAKQEMEISKNGMAELHPADSRFKQKYAKLRFDYEVANKFVEWLSEAISTGSQAEFQLEEDYS